jgi:hypothetical protein
MRFKVVIASLLLTGSLYGEVIDRIVAAVDNHIVTMSDVRRERSVRLALGETPSKDDATIRNELIDVYLIQAQIAQFPGVEIDAADVEAQVNRIGDRQGADTDALREGIRRRLQTGRYFDLRFRQFITATEDEIQAYYDNVFAPEARRRGLNPIPPLSDVAQMIRSNVIEEKLEREVDTWLEAVRLGSDIEIFE